MDVVWECSDLEKLNLDWQKFIKQKRLELLYKLPAEIVEWFDDLIFTSFMQIESNEEEKESGEKEEVAHEATLTVKSKWKGKTIELSKIYFRDGAFDDDSPWLLFGEYDEEFAFSRTPYEDVFNLASVSIDDDSIETKVNRLLHEFQLERKFNALK